MSLLRDIHPTIAEILDGKHDQNLNAFEQAVNVRRAQQQRETGIRKDARVRVTDAAAERVPHLVGRVGKVERVNPKTVSVDLDPLHERDFRTGWRLPASWLEAE